MPIDWVALSGMVFTLLLALVIGGFVLMYPLSRRLGKLMEQRLEERQEAQVVAPEVLEELRAAVQSLETEVARLADRQAFMERLLEAGPPRRGASPATQRQELPAAAERTEREVL